MSIPQAKHEMRIGVLNEVLKIGVLGMRSGIETSVCRGKKALRVSIAFQQKEILYSLRCVVFVDFLNSIP
jgi:hypothetical protein